MQEVDAKIQDLSDLAKVLAVQSIFSADVEGQYSALNVGKKIDCSRPESFDEIFADIQHCCNVNSISSFAAFLEPSFSSLRWNMTLLLTALAEYREYHYAMNDVATTPLMENHS